MLDRVTRVNEYPSHTLKKVILDDFRSIESKNDNEI